MIYQFHLNKKEKDIFVNIPDDFCQETALKLFQIDDFASIVKMNPDMSVKYMQPDDPDEEIETFDIHQIFHPSLFINYNEIKETMTPDMKYFQPIDEKFFDNLMYYWSTIDDYNTQILLDKIEASGQNYLTASALIQDIVE